jgi:hypothetical protein
VPEDLNAVVGDLKAEIERLRDGEEDGWTEGSIPSPGQFLKRLHEQDAERRIRNLEVLLEAGEAGRQCYLGQHDANLQELRQRVMGAWSALAEIAQLCRDPERDGLLHVSEVNDLLPAALRYG